MKISEANLCEISVIAASQGAAALEDFEAAEEAELRDVRDSLKSAEEKANAAQVGGSDSCGQVPRFSVQPLPRRISTNPPLC